MPSELAVRDAALGLIRRQSLTVFEHRNIELEDAVRSDRKGRFGVAVGDLKVVSEILLPAEFGVSIGASWSIVFSVKAHSLRAAVRALATERGRMLSQTLRV